MEELGHQKRKDDRKFAPKFIDSTFNNNLGRVYKTLTHRKILLWTAADCILITMKKQNYN